MLWKTLPVDVNPDISLTSWKVVEVESTAWEGKSRHFVGYNFSNREGRVSSEIKEYDQEKKIGVTRSGRKYHLAGSSGHDLDAEYVFSAWCELNKVTSIEDVTKDFLGPMVK